MKISSLLLIGLVIVLDLSPLLAVNHDTENADRNRGPRLKKVAKKADSVKNAKYRKTKLKLKNSKAVLKEEIDAIPIAEVEKLIFGPDSILPEELKARMVPNFDEEDEDPAILAELEAILSGVKIKD